MTITSKGQVTIFVEIREKLGLIPNADMILLTIDLNRYRTYFSTLELIAPQS
jgi:bifunctional DNA-binding transcriptional regulator/antitoxin component of YhaV-PrlF toxin-antitoxin module